MRQIQIFLKNEFQMRKEKNPQFSLRAFAKWLDMSPAQVSQMISGKRNITPKALKKIVGRLDVSPVEKKKLLGSFHDGQGVEVKEKIALAEDQFRMISDWYHLAILSLTRIKGSSSDPRWIARRLGITVEEANQAVMRLERMGLLQTKPQFKQIGEPFEVTSTVPSSAIRKYHKQNLDLASLKLESVPLEFRQFQSISFAMRPKQVVELKALIDGFLSEVQTDFENERATEIYHLNVQLFPVTVIEEKK